MKYRRYPVMFKDMFVIFGAESATFTVGYITMTNGETEIVHVTVSDNHDDLTEFLAPWVQAELNERLEASLAEKPSIELARLP